MKKNNTVLISYVIGISLFIGLINESFALNEDGNPEVSVEEAIDIAKNFALYNSTEHFPIWRNADHFDTKKVFSSDDILVSYEVSIYSKRNEHLGYVVVSAQEGNGEVVTSFFSEGLSKAQILDDYFSKKLTPFFEKKQMNVVSKKLIGTTTGAYAIGLRFENDDQYLRNVRLEGGYYLFSLDGNNTMSLSYKDKKRLKSKQQNKASYNEEAELRKALISADFSSNLFQEQSSGKISGLDKIEMKPKSSAYIDKSFSSLYQENRKWEKGGLTNNTCYAGCAPVAWTILLEYWDRNGYPKLISTDKDNSNTSTTDPDTRWTISELRAYLSTTCTKDGQGSTTYANAVNGVSYAKSRGYNSSSASNDAAWYSTIWWNLISAIDNKKPPIAALDTNGDTKMDHSAVIYSYIDNWGTSNDSYCFRTGWQNTTATCYTTQNKLYGLTRVTIQ